jgi:Fic family protein
MKWNWQQADWPNFNYDHAKFDESEKRLLLGAGLLFGAFKHLDDDDKRQLTIELISNEALKTSAIEGEYLDRDSLQSSIQRQFGLITDNRKISAAEQGIAEVMVDLYRSFNLPLSHSLLFEWHSMLTNGRRDLNDIGRYRTHAEPMQIVSGAIYAPKVHFEAPLSAQMMAEMEQFIAWFNDTAPTGKSPLPALLRAGIAHLYFVSIHPFEDGNGRIGRALAEKALAQCLGQPTLIAIAYTIERNKKAYYNALEQANRRNEITPWLLHFADLVLNAQRYTATWIEFLISKAKLYERLRGQLNPRQEKVLARLFREGPEGFIGGLSAEKYIGITGAPRATATRDLQDLVGKGALLRRGERKHTRYLLNLETI